MIGADFIDLAAFLITTALKVTLVMVLASILALLLKRASSAARYWVWATAILCTLFLPLSSATIPRWEVPFKMPGPSAWASAASASALSGGREHERHPGATGTGRPSLSRIEMSPRGGARESTRSAPSDEGAQQSIVRWLLYVWAFGTSILLLRIAAGWLQVYRLRRAAEPMLEPGWTQLLKDSAREAGVAQQIELLRSDSAPMPMTWGLFRPVVLLPRPADSWPSGRRRVVLLHELAHVARRDCLMQALAEITCAFHWFHPLVWFASRRMRVEREQACDDRVLAAGESASAYAGHLLDVARVCRSLRLGSAVAAAMARPSHLEGRLLAILDGHRERNRPGRRARTIGVASATCLLVLLSGASAASAPAPREASEFMHGLTTAGRAEQSAEAISNSVRPLMEAESPMSSKDGSSSPVWDQGRSELPVAAERGSSATMRITPSGPMLTTMGADPDTVPLYSIAAYPGEAIQVDLNSGGEVRIVGWERESVEVRASGRGRPNPVVSLTRGEGGVRLASSFASGENKIGSDHFEIRVPASAQLMIRSAMGGIAVDGVRGSVSGHTGGGDIQLDRLDGEVQLSTGRGEVLISDSDVTGEVRTIAGDLRLRNVKGAVHVITAAGRGYFDNAGARMTAIPPVD